MRKQRATTLESLEGRYLTDISLFNKQDATRDFSRLPRTGNSSLYGVQSYLAANDESFGISHQ